MIAWLIRLLLLRILPERLVPVLTLLEVARLIQRWRRGRRPGSPGRTPGAPPTAARRWQAPGTGTRAAPPRRLAPPPDRR